jgi:hypothetical protein
LSFVVTYITRQIWRVTNFSFLLSYLHLLRSYVSYLFTFILNRILYFRSIAISFLCLATAGEVWISPIPIAVEDNLDFLSYQSNSKRKIRNFPHIPAEAEYTLGFPSVLTTEVNMLTTFFTLVSCLA